jgi:MtN3 and saliva related transmembrane protein
MNNVALIGYTAAIFTTIAYVPQTIKVIKTKSTGDISLEMFACLCVGIFLWMIYGFFLHSMPLIIANMASLVMSMVILGYKIKYN